MSMDNKPFLPADEQRFYDDVVHGLRSQGWSRLEAEGEALDRLEKWRRNHKQSVVVNAEAWAAQCERNS